MEQLEPLLNQPGEAGKGQSVVFVEDARTAQRLVVESDEPLAAYGLDRDGVWPEGEPHPDGVVIGELDGEVWVCFVELKGTLRAKAEKEVPSEKALRQLEGGVRHFHPLDDTNGAEHHERWSRQADLPRPTPAPNHRVVGIAVAFRHVPRPPPNRVVALGSQRVPLRVAHLSANQRNQVRLGFRQLLRVAGFL